MSELDDFLEDTLPRQIEAEKALHNGDLAPRLETWSKNDPVILFGAFGPCKSGWDEVSRTFRWVASRFSNNVAYEFELVAAGISGDLAYTLGYERHSTSLDGGLSGDTVHREPGDSLRPRLLLARLGRSPRLHPKTVCDRSDLAGSGGIVASKVDLEPRQQPAPRFHHAPRVGDAVHEEHAPPDTSSGSGGRVGANPTCSGLRTMIASDAMTAWEPPSNSHTIRASAFSRSR